jgi:hypothetical protein
MAHFLASDQASFINFAGDPKVVAGFPLEQEVICG